MHLTFENPLFERDPGSHVATVMLNRPERLNAINRAMMAEILEACRQIQDDDDTWVAIWTGAGRGFCSGADVGGGAPTEAEDTLRPRNCSPRRRISPSRCAPCHPPPSA